MADRHLPDAFATDLTGVYATDPHYGSNLIAIMKLYNLYRYSAPDAQHAAPRAAPRRRRRHRPRRYRPHRVDSRAGRPISTARIREARSAWAASVNLNGQASQDGSDGQGSQATQHRSATQRGSARQDRSARQGRPGGPGGQGGLDGQGGLGQAVREAVPAPPGTAGRRSPASLTPTSPGRPARRRPRRHRTPGPRIPAARRRGSRRARPGPAGQGEPVRAADSAGRHRPRSSRRPRSR